MTKINNSLGRNFNRTRTSDKISEERRSYNMSKIRSRGTKFELDFINCLEKEINLDFELNCKDIKGKPDIVFRQFNVLIFLDSDFWHGWQFPRWKHLMKNDFWVNKIENNRKRDKKVTQNLRRKGWKVIRIWEHNIKSDRMSQIIRIKEALFTDEKVKY